MSAVQHRCLFDTSSGDFNPGWWADCVVCHCRRPYVYDMLKCEICHLLVHKTCAIGASMVDTVRPAVLAVASTQTDRETVRHVACGSDEPSVRALETQTARTTVQDVACETGVEPSVRAEETQTARVAVHEVALGSDFAECATVVERNEEVAPEPTPSAPANAENTAAVQPPAETHLKTFKYWKKRFALFSKFDEGVLLDEESFFSVCPEVLAAHMAQRCAFDTVLDPFCGAGGNAIQLALTCRKVIAIDIDANKIKMARKNAGIYGVANRIEFIIGDSFKVTPGMRADALVTSPPWGGPSYSAQPTYDARDLCGRDVGGLAAILKLAGRVVTSRILLHVPKNIDLTQCSSLARKGGFRVNEFEKVSIDGRPNALNIYFKEIERYPKRGSPPPRPTVTKHIDLKTQTWSQQQQFMAVRTNNPHSYRSYLKHVSDTCRNEN